MEVNGTIKGGVVVLDAPIQAPDGTRVKVEIETAEEAPTVEAAPQVFQPLNIQIDPELSNAIALDPAFDIEES